MGFSDGNSLDSIVKSIRQDSQYKKGGKIPKAQNGGNWKAMKNSEWQNNKPKPFVHGSAAIQEYKPTVQPRTNWVNPPASVTGSETNPRKRPDLNGMKKGGSTDKNWIQKAINPAHKGYCTPMTKATCTPKRKALAMTLKKIAKNK
jgi:hypothetical protein